MEYNQKFLNSPNSGLFLHFLRNLGEVPLGPRNELFGVSFIVFSTTSL